MSHPVIRVTNLGKQYRVGLRAAAQRTVGARLVHACAAPWRRWRDVSEGGPGSTFWALRGVTFDVRPGEVVGLIGRNGAGKSTLLKILSRITEPTAGQAELRGNVRSLLEVGTGFHPDLTGRENIYLNGAILGMKKTEIDGAFDDIVAYAEIDRFLDTPVKRYSSGMYVRLAFAVAAHLQPEILIVDEVLAVGDAAFQAKCLGTMRNVAASGRTVLFVSHNLAAIQQLCTRVLLLDGGQVRFDGDPRAAIRLYLGAQQSACNRAAFAPEAARDAQILEMAVTGEPGTPLSRICAGQPWRLRVRYAVRHWRPGFYVCVAVENELGVIILWSGDIRTPADLQAPRAPGVYEATIHIPGELAPGQYACSAAICLAGARSLDFRERAVRLEIQTAEDMLARFGIQHPAVTAIPLHWSTAREGSTDNSTGEKSASLAGAAAPTARS